MSLVSRAQPRLKGMLRLLGHGSESFEGEVPEANGSPAVDIGRRDSSEITVPLEEKVGGLLQEPKPSSSLSRSLPEHLLNQTSTGEEREGSLDPRESHLEPLDWYEDLGEASGLDTSPDTGLLSLPTVATEDGATYAMVVHRVAEVLDFKLSSVPVVLTEVLQPGLPHRN
ncbi:hypothetical protein NDU88_004058 [Pleurodeles waltl]|uniref:Uncharacterized protein n=1 Tax=Pleurodeles waltl TaxID=8319 RepID=A0AAV7KYA7_PLEWA|nr:hypothetical protein NDU88_004058 [Pleurodeles waltl]